MKKTKLRPDRLRQLALYLISDKANEIDYEITQQPVEIDHGDFVEKQVSFFMQAIGESLFVFKEQWIVNEQGQIVWQYDRYQSIFSSAMSFYGLTEHQFQHLFIPEFQMPLLFGGERLDYVVHPKQIGENILAMLDRIQLQLN